jgi:hypothetical protein
MICTRGFLLSVASVFAIQSAIAQPVPLGPICSGLKSVNWCHQFDPGVPSAMAVDANGMTYVAYGSTVTALGPDGSVVYTAQFLSPVNSLALGKSGTLWAVTEASIDLVDGQGNQTPVNYAYFGNEIRAVSSDAAGNLCIAGATPSTYNSIIRLSPAGEIVGVFPIDAYGFATAVAVDPTGAVYVIGAPSKGFKATPGALQTSIPTGLIYDAYLLKIAPDLDHVVYATYLCQGQCFNTPVALKVDSQGNAYVGIDFNGTIGFPPFPAKEIGLPLLADGGSLNVLKVNPEGSTLVWSAGLGPGSSFVALTVLPDGQARALVNLEGDGETLVTVSAAGDRIESANLLAGTPESPVAPVFLAAAPGVNAPLRMLVGLNSSRIPVAFNDETMTPVVVDFADPPPQADLSLELTLLQPVVISSALTDFRATVRNQGLPTRKASRLSQARIISSAFLMASRFALHPVLSSQNSRPARP